MVSAGHLTDACLGWVLWRNYDVTILGYGTLVVTILGEVFGGILSVTILL